MADDFAILNDTHFGCRSDHPIFQAYLADFFKGFFEEIDRRGIKHILHLGDLVDRRKYVNYLTAWNLHKSFIQPIIDRDIELVLGVGNHDTFYKEDLWLNAMDVLYGDRLPSNMRIIKEPSTISFAGQLIDVYPWIVPANYEKSLDLMKAPGARIAFGHFELAGFEMQRGSIMHEGMNPDLLMYYEYVGSGHYHEKSRKGKIDYYGVQYPLTWADADTPKGWHIYKRRIGEIEFVQNPVSCFQKIFFDGEKYGDSVVALSEMPDLKNKIVKVFVSNKGNPIEFERFMSDIETQNPFQLQVISERQEVAEDELVSESDDTLQILLKYVDATNSPHKDDVGIFMQELYNNAMNAKIAE